MICQFMSLVFGIFGFRNFWICWMDFWILEKKRKKNGKLDALEYGDFWEFFFPEIGRDCEVVRRDRCEF